MAFTNTLATIPGFILPFFIDAMTQSNVSFTEFLVVPEFCVSTDSILQQTIGSWRIIFAVAIVLYTIGLIVFVIYGSGDEEPWNRTNSTERSVSYSRGVNETTPFRGGGDSSKY